MASRRNSAASAGGVAGVSFEPSTANAKKLARRFPKPMRSECTSVKPSRGYVMVLAYAWSDDVDSTTRR